MNKKCGFWKLNVHIHIDRDMTNNEYYFQVQGQMMVTGIEQAFFVIYTNKDLFIQKIMFDIDFNLKMYNNLLTFFQNYHSHEMNLINKLILLSKKKA